MGIKSAFKGEGKNLPIPSSLKTQKLEYLCRGQLLYKEHFAAGWDATVYLISRLEVLIDLKPTLHRRKDQSRGWSFRDWFWFSLLSRSLEINLWQQSSSSDQLYCATQGWSCSQFPPIKRSIRALSFIKEERTRLLRVYCIRINRDVGAFRLWSFMLFLQGFISETCIYSSALKFRCCTRKCIYQPFVSWDFNLALL